MRILTFLCCFLFSFPSLAIYDLASFNITPSPQGTQFCFLLDTPEKEIYLALTTDEQNFLFLSPDLNTTLWQPPAVPPAFFTNRFRPGCYGPFDASSLQGVQLYAGVGSSFNELVEHQKYLKIFGGSPTLTSESKPWTVMVYMVGSSLERQLSKTPGNASKDIVEMLAGTRLPENRNINVIITTGGSSREGWKTVKRSLVQNGQLHVLEDLGEQSMATPQTLSDFVLWAKGKFPAEHYALVLWNHGGGTQGFGQDTSKNSQSQMMSLAELHQAYQTIADKGKLDLVTYDACVMASLEVAEVTAKVTNFMSGSVEVEPSHGIDYTYFLKQLSTALPTDGITVGNIIKTGYIQQTKEKRTFDTDQITYSIFDLTQLPNVRTAFGSFTEELLRKFDDSSFLSYEALSRGIIRAPGYPRKETGRFRSLQTLKNVRVDLYNMLETIAPSEFTDLQAKAKMLQTALNQMVVEYETNDLMKSVDQQAGRISIDIGSDRPYLAALPAEYTKFTEALNLYNKKRNNDTSQPTGEFTCPSGFTCADAKWWNLQSSDVISVDGYYGQQAEQGVNIHLIKSLYRYQPIGKDLEIGVNGQEACRLELCSSDAECSPLTVTEDHGLWLADVKYNDLSAVLTLCRNDSQWQVCSVLAQSSGVWGRSESVVAGDVIVPTLLNLQDKQLSSLPSPTLTVGDNVPFIRQQCDAQQAVITASFSGINNQRQFERLCNKGDCVCKANDLNESCIATANQFRAGIRIVY